MQVREVCTFNVALAFIDSTKMWMVFFLSLIICPLQERLDFVFESKAQESEKEREKEREITSKRSFANKH